MKGMLCRIAARPCPQGQNRFPGLNCCRLWTGVTDSLSTLPGCSAGMKEYSQWPTFPQVYIAGEFYGGADILIASYTNGELAETLEAAMNA